MDEDAIDTEALQAQIDLSMSFAQNLVSSWIQPQKIPRNPHKKNLEKELSEYMKRPARLGVGASIPEGYNSTRETARLKGKLAGTKHSREDGDAITPQSPSDTEGESRANVIKKRPKYDPFDVVHGKKKKKEKDIVHDDADPQPITVNSNVPQLHATISPKEETANQYLDGPEPNSPTLSASKKKKKRKKLKLEGTVESCQAEVSSALLCNGSNKVLNSPLTPPRSAEELNCDATPKRTADVSLTSTPMLNTQPRHKPIPLDLLKRPLLNLKHHSDQDSDHEGTPSSNLKKKRKRRRKKKHSRISSAADTKINDTRQCTVEP